MAYTEKKQQQDITRLNSSTAVSYLNMQVKFPTALSPATLMP